MSGVFFIVEEQGENPSTSILRPTKGGYPHITMAYTGDKKGIKILIETANSMFIEWTDMKDTPLPEVMLLQENAYVNAFYESTTKRTRYDVILNVRDQDAQTIENLRNNQFKKDDEDLVLRYPHVTHSIHYNEDDASNALEEVKKRLPITATVTGYTVA